MFEIKVVEKIKTHFMSSNFFSENRAVYEIMSKKVEPEAADDNMAEYRMLDN